MSLVQSPSPSSPSVTQVKVQVTPCIKGSYDTVAVNTWLPAGEIDAPGGLIVTVGVGTGVTVTVELPDFVGSANEVALTETGFGTGIAAGAV